LRQDACKVAILLQGFTRGEVQPWVAETLVEL